jgi:ABC-type multidrug transport system ATPase subunit
MKIILSDAGKRFNREWVFRHFDYSFFSAQAYAITGPNGSGKSTLLQFIAGAIMPSEGKITYYIENDSPVSVLHPLLSIAAPYLETIEEMTASEFFRFHQGFKPLYTGLGISEILDRVGLGEAADKQIRYYSSGMKQRIKLAQAFFSDTPLLLLDEPTTNLDAGGIQLYHELIRDLTNERLVIISSNDPLEYSFCKTVIEMNKLKPHSPHSKNLTL